jgi:hypothetical protein
MSIRQLNVWNWEMEVTCYCDNFQTPLTTFTFQQYWDGTRSGHDRIYGACIEKLEDMSDRLGLQYQAFRPAAILEKSWATKTPLVAEIDRLPVR